jgi:hypothetical protein
LTIPGQESANTNNIVIIENNQTTTRPATWSAYDEENCRDQTIYEKLIASFKDTISFALLKDVRFLLLAIMNFLLFFGSVSPYLHMYAIEEDFSYYKPYHFLDLYLYVDIIARIIFGLLADCRCFTPIKLNTVAVLIGTIGIYLYFIITEIYTAHFILSLLYSVGYGI